MSVEPHQSFHHTHLVVFTLVLLVHLDPLCEPTHKGCLRAHLRVHIVTDAAAEGIKEDTLYRVYKSR